jgi:hypothetical protein
MSVRSRPGAPFPRISQTRLPPNRTSLTYGVGISEVIMPTYRLVFIDDRENVLWTRHVDCWGDDQAIEMARKEEESHFGVQVWDGERPVCLVGNPRGNAAMLD